MPLTGDADTGTFWFDDGTPERPDAPKQFATDTEVATPGYFSAMHIPLLRGRLFDASDRLSEEALTAPAESQRERPAGVVLVNQAFARRFWPGGDPIGQKIKFEGHWAVSSSTIVGVVADVRAAGVAREPEPAAYVPFGGRHCRGDRRITRPSSCASDSPVRYCAA